jgi:hypothetical protein
MAASLTWVDAEPGCSAEASASRSPHLDLADMVAQVTAKPDDLPASERFLDDHPDGVTPQLVGLIARARVRSTRP